MEETAYCSAEGCLIPRHNFPVPDCLVEDKPVVAGFNKTETQAQIVAVFDSMKELVLEKNKRYGDSALTPRNIFSKLEAGEGIKVRLDDKISRIMNSDVIRKNDVADIMGYLALLAVSQNWLDFSDLID